MHDQFDFPNRPGHFDLAKSTLDFLVFDTFQLRLPDFWSLVDHYYSVIRGEVLPPSPKKLNGRKQEVILYRPANR